MSYEQNFGGRDFIAGEFTGYDYGRRGYGNEIPGFLSRLSPGIEVELQYDHQPPASGTFQGFEQGNAILTDYNGFPGLVRISPNRINAVSPFGYGRRRGRYDCD